MKRLSELLDRAAVEGRIFGAHMGQTTTPLATAATTALGLTIPHAWIRVPNGTVIIPLQASLTLETVGATTQGEASLVVAANDVGDGTSSAADRGPQNLNPGSSVVSLCTARQLATAAVTTPTTPVEIRRFSCAASAVNQQFDWPDGDNSWRFMLRGPASWLLYLGGNVINYYAQMQWAEFLESDL